MFLSRAQIILFESVAARNARTLGSARVHPHDLPRDLRAAHRTLLEAQGALHAGQHVTVNSIGRLPLGIRNATHDKIITQCEMLRSHATNRERPQFANSVLRGFSKQIVHVFETCNSSSSPRSNCVTRFATFLGGGSGGDSYSLADSSLTWTTSMYCWNSKRLPLANCSCDTHTWLARAELSTDKGDR